MVGDEKTFLLMKKSGKKTPYVFFTTHGPDPSLVEVQYWRNQSKLMWLGDARKRWLNLIKNHGYIESKAGWIYHNGLKTIYEPPTWP